MGELFKKIRVFKRLRELEEDRSVTHKAFGILVSEINKLKKIQDRSVTSTPGTNVCETPEEFMKWFISNP